MSLEMLLSNGASIDVVTDGNILHTLAAFSMTQEERKTNFATGAPNLVNYGLKVPEWYSNLPNDKNGTPEQMLKLLLDAGADVNARNSSELNPLLRHKFQK